MFAAEGLVRYMKSIPESDQERGVNLSHLFPFPGHFWRYFSCILTFLLQFSWPKFLYFYFFLLYLFSRNCNPGTDGFPPTLDETKIRGRITVCEHSDYRYAIKQKLEIVISQGGIGVILVVDHTRRFASSAYRTSPISAITESDGTEVLSYIRSSR